MNTVENEARQVKEKIDSFLNELYQGGALLETIEIRLGYRAAANLEIACGRECCLTERVTLNGHRIVYQDYYYGIPVFKVLGDLDLIEVRQ